MHTCSYILSFQTRCVSSVYEYMYMCVQGDICFITYLFLTLAVVTIMTTAPSAQRPASSESPEVVTEHQAATAASATHTKSSTVDNWSSQGNVDITNIKHTNCA